MNDINIAKSFELLSANRESILQLSSNRDLMSQTKWSVKDGEM